MMIDGGNKLGAAAATALGLVLALAPLEGAMAQSFQQAGVSAAVRGQVQLTSAATQLKGGRIDSGQRVFMGDQLATAPASGAQLMLLDQTVFTLGEDSAVTVDEFVYDPGSNAGKMAASVTRGAFRYVSGRVAKAAPEQVNIRVPAGNIGIRGTIVLGKVQARSDGAAGSETLVALAGPGRDNNNRDLEGKIDVTGDGGQTVSISRPGYATILRPNLPPVVPFALPPEMLAAMSSALVQGNAAPTPKNSQVVGLPAGQTAAETALDDIGRTSAFIDRTLSGTTDGAEEANRILTTVASLNQAGVASFQNLLDLVASRGNTTIQLWGTQNLTSSGGSLSNFGAQIGFQSSFNTYFWSGSGNVNVGGVSGSISFGADFPNPGSSSPVFALSANASVSSSGCSGNCLGTFTVLNNGSGGVGDIAVSIKAGGAVADFVAKRTIP